MLSFVFRIRIDLEIFKHDLSLRFQKSNRSKQLKWFEWTTIYSLIAIDDDFFANASILSRVAVHLIQTIQEINHTANPQFNQFILNRVRSSIALKRLLDKSRTLIGNDREFNALCLSLFD